MDFVYVLNSVCVCVCVCVSVCVSVCARMHVCVLARLWRGVGWGGGGEGR